MIRTGFEDNEDASATSTVKGQFRYQGTVNYHD
jgi:hypothetical protein